MTDPRQPDARTTRTLATGRDMLAPGTVLAGRYRIVGIGGIGGMGVVYHARDLQLDVDVAVKLLHPDRIADEPALERFRREVLLARKVSHPNVVRLHDIGEDGGLLFFTMDHVDARTLAERLADGPLPLDTALGVGVQIADALAAAHAEGVVHRDLKPSNVLVDDQGRTWLTDFGIARALGDEGVTRAGELVGTLEYLAPEQVRGDAITPSADVFALGLVLWEMFTGEVPLRGATRDETLARRAAGRAPGRLPGAGRVPARIERIVRRCLEPAPGDRYRDAAALRDDLVRGRRGLDVGRWAKRAGVAALTAIAAVGAWQWLPTATERAPAPEHRVAVLPFENATGDASLDWVQRALAEHVTQVLSANPSIQPVDSVRVFRSLDDLRITAAAVDDRALRDLTELFSSGLLVRGRVIGGDGGMRLQLRAHTRTDERRYEADVTPATMVGTAERLARALIADLHVGVRGVVEPPRASESAAALTAFDEGVARLARGERGAAAAALERAVAEDPTFGIAWLRLAEVLRESGHYDRAVEAAAHATRTLGTGEGRHALRARATHAALAGDMTSALAASRRIVELYPLDTDALVAYGELLGDAGRYEEAIARLGAATELDPQHPRAWFLLGKFGILSGEVRRAAEDWLVRALVVQNRFGTDSGRAEVLNALGIANEQLGALAAAAAHYRESARLRGAAGDLRGESASLANLARLKLVAGDMDDARETLARALALRERIGDLPGVADLRNEFGVLEEEAGRYGEALEHYTEALRLRSDLGDVRGVAESYGNLAFANMLHGRYDTAEAFAARALTAFDEAGSADGRMLTLLTVAQLRIRRGDWDGARAAVVEALAAARRIGNPFAEAAAEGLIGELSRQQGRAAAALDAYGRALEIVDSLGDRRGVAEYRLQRAELWLDLHLVEAARVDVREAAGALDREGSLAQLATLARIEAGLAAAEGDAATARARFAEARSYAARTGSEAVVLAVAVAQASWTDEVGPPALEALARDAARLGDRPLRLAALTRLAEIHLAHGAAEAAHAVVREATRPPVALEPWRGNWRLHWTAAIAERETGLGDGESALERVRELLAVQWSGLPDAVREGLHVHPARELMHAVAIQD